MNDDTAHPSRLGGCQCGAVRYALTGEPLKIVVCHCRECRKQSASAFGVSVFVARTQLHLTRGTPKLWSRPTDSGNTLICAFCAECGSRLWHQRVSTPETISVKGGSLDDPVDLRTAIHIWTARMLPGIIVPHDAVRFPGEPE
ncbi:MAG: GFA family protein [Azoarcus sp.]|nr:GFA family protein [Azoarcus sp.]